MRWLQRYNAQVEDDRHAARIKREVARAAAIRYAGQQMGMLNQLPGGLLTGMNQPNNAQALMQPIINAWRR